MQLVLGNTVSGARCAACDERLLRRALFCPGCACTVERWQGQGEPIAFGAYGGALAQALLRLKYGARPDLAQGLGELLGACVMRARPDLGPIDLTIPVPVPRSRLVQRGYNQAALISRSVVAIAGGRLACRILERKDGGRRQAGLGRSERLINLQGAFAVCDAGRVRGKTLLLVDDVSTTGATLAACREVLLEVGAAAVHSAVVARTDSLAVQRGVAM